MGWKDRLYLGFGVVLASMPFVINLLLLLSRNRYLQMVTTWRYWVATGGLVLGLLASFPTPLFYFALQLPWHIRGDWGTMAAVYCMPTALIAGLVALVLLAFGQGRVRWMGMAVTFVSVGFLYVTLLGLSD
jgi:hypothetical protein